MFSILHKMRYRFEFTLLPGLLFTEPEAALQIDAPALYALWHLFSNGVETGEAPYREEDYKVRAVTGQEGVRMTVAEMPAPKTPPLC